MIHNQFCQVYQIKTVIILYQVVPIAIVPIAIVPILIILVTAVILVICLHHLRAQQKQLITQAAVV